jgi:copper chaperone NosL
MKKVRMTSRGRILTLLCGIALFTVLLFPMWQIQLSAPQYPEGLVLNIYPNKLGGNVDVINGLNHYIGMKTLHTEDFVEFKVLPYIIVFFGVALLLAAFRASRRMLNVVSIIFVCFGVIAMVDFWKWEYDYGHNLNPDAAIIVPGMAYQPPLIGFKQLLNFGAYSIPDIGGWIFVGTGILLVLAVATEWKAAKKKVHLIRPLATQAMLLAIFFSSCTTAPEPITIGKDACDYCKMKMSDNRFGAELITKKGKAYKFDDIHCILAFIKESGFDRSRVEAIYLTDFSGSHALIRANEAVLLKSEELMAPMGGHIAAFSNADSLQYVSIQYRGAVIHWDELYRP